MPQAKSATSRPRPTSPRASLNTLPCSAVIRRARSAWCWATSSRNANSTCTRLVSDIRRHSAAAAVAEVTTVSTSAADASRT